MPIESKYIVIKVDDFEQVRKDSASVPVRRALQQLDAAALDDESFFVIREQDVFGPMAVYGYCHLIQSSLELDALPDRRVFTDEEREYLAEVADKLHDLGLKWATSSKKVPD